MLPTSDNSGDSVTYSELSLIVKPASQYLQALDLFMEKQAEEFEVEIKELVQYCLINSGKRLRPILVFFSGWISDDNIEKDLVKAAAVIEFVHMASLVHDDVLDEAKIRRSETTASKKFGPNVAVLLGDALFSQALRLAAEFPVIDVCRLVSESTRRVCAGEIKQTFQQGNPKVSMSDYFRMIDLKTAELFSVSCTLGAKLSDYNEDFVSAVGLFGRHLGTAYQIYDDLIDFIGSEESIGKTLGTDINNRKYTLPIILLLERIKGKEYDHVLNEIQNADSVDINSINLYMAKNGIFEIVENYFRIEIEAANKALEIYLDNPPIKHLMELSRYFGAQINKLLVY